MRSDGERAIIYNYFIVLFNTVYTYLMWKGNETLYISFKKQNSKNKNKKTKIKFI